MISYNLLEDVLNKKINNEDAVKYYCKAFNEIFNGNLIMDNNLEELNEISEYEALNIGIEYYESNESSYDSLYDKNNQELKIINNIIDRKKNDMMNFVKELKKTDIPLQANEENKYRILSFPWCICGHFLTNMKFLNFQINS